MIRQIIEQRERQICLSMVSVPGFIIAVYACWISSDLISTAAAATLSSSMSSTGAGTSPSSPFYPLSAYASTEYPPSASAAEAGVVSSTSADSTTTLMTMSSAEAGMGTASGVGVDEANSAEEVNDDDAETGGGDAGRNDDDDLMSAAYSSTVTTIAPPVLENNPNSNSNNNNNNYESNIDNGNNITKDPLLVTTTVAVPMEYSASANAASSSNSNAVTNPLSSTRDRTNPVNLLKDKLKAALEENPNFRTVLPALTTPNTETEPSLSNSMGAIAKPQKYHYYPHNQHMYLLPECAVQQVCSAVYVRLNYTQPLCACPSRYGEPCSASLNSDDLHTTELSVDAKGKILTLVKTCEPVKEMRLCRAPRDWSLLALQNVRTGKSHYLVICHCPETSILEGPTTHDQPTYASVPGIKVYGMVCINRPDSGVTIMDTHIKRKLRLMNNEKLNHTSEIPFPFHKIKQLLPYIDT